MLYVANLFRVVLEYWLVYNGILPWSLAHYPLSLVLGVVGMFFLVTLADKLMPEFGDIIYSIVEKIGKLIKRKSKSALSSNEEYDSETKDQSY